MLRRLSALALPLALAACATEAPPPKAPPPPPPAVVPPPTPPVDWRDLPVDPGSWSYARDGEGSSARFGAAPAFLLGCLKATRQISLMRSGAPTATSLSIRTSYGARTLPAAGGIATVAAGDPLFDQIAFSRARFSVEAAGAPLLMMPAWAEPARVIEDCRS